MRILITGAAGNVARGVIPRLRAAGHELVLTDVSRLRDTRTFDGLEFVQCDLQIGFGLELAAQGCDLVLHTAAWHGIHSGEKTEVDFWRLNVDGTFKTLQAARAAGVMRVVFLSSLAWHDHYGKYGFTKRVGEDLCEYTRRNHGVRYIALRPADFTPWGDEWVNR
jgi:nucleoside-diphosphate-sugar epimerase